jgi:hypothetical protein
MIATEHDVENGSLHDSELLPQRSSFTEAQARGEVDTQISTAHRYPRSIKAFRQKALSLATLDEDTAASCFYSLPRDGKTIEGPSARLAEIVAVSWGNLRSQANVVDIDDKWVTARGVCWDLEANVAVSVEVRRRITSKNGRRYNDDMIGVTSNAACAIALRNAVFKVVPMAMLKPIYEQARKVAIGDAQTLSSRRQKMVDHFGKMSVRPEQICAKVGKASIEDITLDDLGTLIGLATAIKDGDTTIDEAFAVEKPATNGDHKPPASKSEEIAAKLKRPAAKPVAAAKPEQTTDELELLSEAEGSNESQDSQEQPESETTNQQETAPVAGQFLARDTEKSGEYVQRLLLAIAETQSPAVLDAIGNDSQTHYDRCGKNGFKMVTEGIEKRRKELVAAQQSGDLIS